MSDGSEDAQEALAHCKFSLSETPGARIKDLYEVCGQTQKSTAWGASPDKKRELFSHLLYRNALRMQRTGTERFELGDADTLVELREMAGVLAVSLRMFIAQPGLSREGASREQLELLSVTENYLWQTYQIPMRVIGSA